MDNNSKGLGCGSVIQIVFIILKLTGLIDWSWLWVLSPLWISIVVSTVIVLPAAVILSVTDDKDDKKDKIDEMWNGKRK